MHDDEISIDTGTAAALIAAQFPAYAKERVSQLAWSGTVNAIFRVGHTAVARFPLRLADAATAEREAAAIDAFARLAPVAAPKVIGIGRPAAAFPLPWTVLSWVEGAIASPDGHADSEPFALDLARLIGALRAMDSGGRSFERSGRGGALIRHDEWVATCLAKSQGLLDVPRLAGMWQQMRVLPKSGPEVMSHGDLIPANLLVEGERLVGVLDTGHFGPADRSLDLVVAWHCLDTTRRELLRKVLGCSDLEWRRGAAWAFEQAIGLVWYYRDTNPSMSALGRSTLGRIVETYGAGN